MNLTMPPDIIEELSKRGECAAVELARRYKDNPPARTELTWDNHRWIRLRTALHLLHRKLLAAQSAYLASQGLRSYDDLTKAPPSYDIRQGTIADLVNDLEHLLQSWGADVQGTHGDVPDPEPELRIVPRF